MSHPKNSKKPIITKNSTQKAMNYSNLMHSDTNKENDPYAINMYGGNINRKLFGSKEKSYE